MTASADVPSPAASLRDARRQVLARPGLVGAGLRAALVAAVDGWVATQLADEPGTAVVAVGGYGRREPAPGSDLDLVLLHRDRPDVAAVADRLWYPIWDAGVRLDHAVRTVAEAVTAAREDLKAALGLLDARHVAGDAQLTADLRAAALAEWRRDARRRLAELRELTAARWQDSGELPFLLEPDLKNSRGGLRDVHASTAAAAAWVADPPSVPVRAAAELLLDVRGELHRRQTRPSDRFVLQEHAPVAAALGRADVEALLREVSAAGRAIALAADETWRRVGVALRPARRWRQRPPPRRPLADGVVEDDGLVVLARDADPAGDPALLLRVAASAAAADLPIAPHTVERLAAVAPPLPVPWPPAVRTAFLSLLGAGPATVRVWEALDQAGLLDRLVPEWERVRCKPQRNPVHRFTVDRHLIETVSEAARLTRRVSRPDLLLLAALLHDIGKGWPGDHTEAGVAVVPAVCARVGLDAADAQVVVTLVRHHLLLADTATRRDLDDPATIRTVAAAVAEEAVLDLLHALTEADALATGPAAWGEWKAGLVADLVRRTAAALAGAPSAQNEPDPLDAAQLAVVAGAVPAVDVTAEGPGMLRVTVVAPDRPGLLWRWAGVLALHRLEIRSATATSRGSMAVTVFHAAPRFGSPPDEDALPADVRRAYDDALPIAAHLAERERAYAVTRPSPAPPRVVWADGASASATVVEVRAHDSLGLLHRLTRALAEAGLDVRSARLSTLGADVVDAFYVVDERGEPVLDAGRRASIEAALLSACAPAD